MDKRIFICAVIILFLGIAAVLFYHYFEIVQDNISVPPSREYYSNSYLALERWLNASGRPVQTNYWFTLKDYTGTENTFFIIEPYSYLYDDISNETLTQWIYSGKNLIVCLNNIDIDDTRREIIDYISQFGITVGTTPSYYEYTSGNSPDLHWRIKFDIENEENYLTVKDNHNNIRIVRINIGNGSLTIMGYPRFMQNHYLKEEPNARLAWELIGVISDETGVCFVQNTKQEKTQKNLLGTLMQRGNIIPALVSVFILIILGFWMVIPVFGILKDGKKKNSRPIKDRFIAEISFLKKYKGLYYYDEALEKIRSENENNKS